MRITYIHQYFKTPAMAGGTRSFEFARRLVVGGHEVHVITGSPEAGWTGNPHRITNESGIVVHWLAVPYTNAMTYRRRLLAFTQFVCHATLVAIRMKHDLVFATSTPLTVAIPGALAALLRRVPMVLEVRDLWPEAPIALGALRSRCTQWAAWRLEAWAYRHSTQIVALSPGMAESISRRFPNQTVTVIPNCADRYEFLDADEAGLVLRESVPWLQDRPLLLYAGTLGLANGVDYLVDMAATLAITHPDVRIVIVGDGGQSEQLRQQGTELGVLNRNLFILPSVSKEKIKSYFGASDLVVSTLLNTPELASSSPNKVFDGFAAGRPVAVNYGGWIAEIISESGAGLVLPPDDPKNAAVVVSKLLADGPACEAARMAASALARERFDRDLLFRRFEQVLLGAANERDELKVGAGPDPSRS